MEKQEYNNLIINGKLNELANISMVDDLIRYRYLNRYLISYLLDAGIHTNIMDSRAILDIKWTKYYLKYNITKPLLKCHLKPLLMTINNELVLDTLLKKLNNADRIKLYENLKENNYWEIQTHEQEIRRSYAKVGITLPEIFIKKPLISDQKKHLSTKYKDLIEKFRKTFSETEENVLDAYTNEFKKRLLVNDKRMVSDIKKIIEYKKMHKDFSLNLSCDTEGEYNSEKESITISPYRYLVLTHELSHLMYDDIEVNKRDIIKEYISIQNSINNDETIKKIVQYLDNFHKNYEYMKSIFKEMYYHEIKKKYKSYDEYIKAICTDIYKYHPDIIAIDDEMVYFYVDNDNIEDIVAELIHIEEEEYININVRNYYTEELLLENMLDALLNGKICDGMLDIDCLSGHAGCDFMDDYELSFNECLADYDAIKNSSKNSKLINDLEKLVGLDIIDFLEDYLLKYRGMKNGK